MENIRKKRYERFRPLEKFGATDLEMVRLVLRGGSVLDLRRLYFNATEARAFCRAQRLDLEDPGDLALVERIRDEAVSYLREEFEFPIPGPVRRATLVDLLLMASDINNRHRQLCACTLLKAMHVINHFDAGEARQALMLADQDLFKAAEQRIYRTVSKMMAERLPVVEFMGGRKKRSSMVTKLLSKQDPLSAQLFDKMRFRVVTASKDDVLPTINFLARNLFPFNYVLAGESYNTLIPFATYCDEHPTLSKLVGKLGIEEEIDDHIQPMSNEHSSPEYRVVHWVSDMPLRIAGHEDAFDAEGIHPLPRPVVYIRAEIQILDRRTHRRNERGEASHRKYKARQQTFVRDRLRVGTRRRRGGRGQG